MKKERLLVIQVTNRQSGFSLIELLISFLISSVVLLGALNLFISNKLSYNLQQSINSVQEEGRYAMQALSKGFMHAGYSEDNSIASVIRVFDSENPDVLNVVRLEQDANGNLSGGQQYSVNGNGNEALFDQIIVRVGGGKDCIGEDTNWPATNLNEQWKYYYINGKRQLICTDSLGNLEPLTENVEAFQIQYGIDTNVKGEEGFLNADAYVNYVLPNQRIVSIRFAIMVKSQEVVSGEEHYMANYGIQMLDQLVRQGKTAGLVNYNDGHLRRMFFSTVQLRNISVLAEQATAGS